MVNPTGLCCVGYDIKVEELQLEIKRLRALLKKLMAEVENRDGFPTEEYHQALEVAHAAGVSRAIRRWR